MNTGVIKAQSWVAVRIAGIVCGTVIVVVALVTGQTAATLITLIGFGGTLAGLGATTQFADPVRVDEKIQSALATPPPEK